MAIDYARMQANRRQQKTNLTRALNCTDTVRRKAAVLKTVAETVAQWNDCGGVWPDDWSRWQNALDAQYVGAGYAPRLEEL
jgi:hypothetical protein